MQQLLIIALLSLTIALLLPQSKQNAPSDVMQNKTIRIKLANSSFLPRQWNNILALSVHHITEEKKKIVQWDQTSDITCPGPDYIPSNLVLALLLLTVCFILCLRGRQMYVFM